MKPKNIIGQFEYVELVGTDVENVPARVDTGARTSAVWASDIIETKDGLAYVLFAEGSPLFTGKVLVANEYSKVVVSNSSGHAQVRYKVPLTVRVLGRTIKTFVTLADRSTQAFPFLMGRNTLRGKFVVDVQNGPAALETLDQDRSDELQSLL